MNRLIAIVLATATLLWSGNALAAPVKVVVVENVYSEAVERIGGAGVTLAEILVNPWADPHDYEPTPSAARLISDAHIVIYNGIDYDPWVERVLAASASPRRVALNVATLVGHHSGDNPHVWYDPLAMPALAEAVVKTLTALDPAGAGDYAERGAAYQAELALIRSRVAAIRANYAGTPVTATEPVFGYMVEALALDMRHHSFQRAIMNETQPAARDIAAIEADIKGATVKLLFYNSQVTDALTARVLSLAKAARIPVVPVSETKPRNMTYVEWILGMLDATEAALASQPGRAGGG